MLSPSQLRDRGSYDGVAALINYQGWGSVSFDSGTLVTSPHSWNYFNRITDRINPIGAGGWRAPGPCSHLRIKNERIPSRSWYRESNGTEWGYTFTGGTPGHDLTPAEVEASLPSFPYANLLSLRLSAWNKFHTVIPTEVSLANFLFELKDFKDIFTSLGKARHLKSIPKTKFSKVPAIANSTFLQWNFAWAPFIGDLMKLASLSQNIEKRLNFLRDTRGKDTRVHFRVDDAWSEPGPTLNEDQVYWWRYPLNGPDWDDQQYYALALRQYKAKFAASCTIVQEIDGLNDALTGVKAYYAALGFNNPAKIVWNAIPFSFMVDWIFPMGKLLERLAANPFTGRWDIYNTTSSLTQEMVFDNYANYYSGNAGYTLAGGNQKCGKVKVSTYDRVLGLPLSSSDVEFTSLTNHQQRLFLSLAAGNTLFKGGKH